MRGKTVVVGIAAAAALAAVPVAHATTNTPTNVFVTNSTDHAIPIVGNVNAQQSGAWNVGVNGEVKTRPSIPQSAFSQSVYAYPLQSATIQVFPTAQPAGTNFALTTVTLTNDATNPTMVQLVAHDTVTSSGNCITGSGNNLEHLTDLLVAPQSTLVVPYQIPLFTDAHRCLEMETDGAGGGTDALYLTALGYRF